MSRPTDVDPAGDDDDVVPVRSARPDAAEPTGNRGGGDDETTRARRGEFGGRNLPIAIVAGVLLAGLFLGSLFWSALAFTVVVAGFVTVAAVETGRELRKVGLPVAVPALIAGGLVTVFGAYRYVHAGQAVGVFTLFAATVAWLLADPQRRDVVRTLSMTMFLGLWTGFLGSFGVLLVDRPTDGAVAGLAVIGAAVLGDIGAYATGVLLGRHKIAPQISPNKTVEGLLGGVVVSAGLAALVLPRMGSLFDVPTAVAVAVVSVLAGFLGDLTESMVKRDIGIKDLGRIIPGHGGILDRVDGILLALPVGFYTLSLMT